MRNVDDFRHTCWGMEGKGVQTRGDLDMQLRLFDLVFAAMGSHGELWGAMASHGMSRAEEAENSQVHLEAPSSSPRPHT